MTSEQQAADPVVEPTVEAAPKRSTTGRNVGLLILAILVVNVVALILVPPFPREGQPGDACSYPVCFIEGTLELPAPHTVWAPEGAPPPGNGLIVFYPSLSSSLVTLFIISISILVVGALAARLRSPVPGRIQNFMEWTVESLSNFGVGLAGAAARPYLPIFIGAFILILVSNWSGLLPIVGRLEFLRAPTSDVNVTLGFALVAFLFFEFQGFRKLGFGGYLGKFFPFYEFKKGISAGLHRHVRGRHRADARVRQAAHALDATLRQHLRRRGGPGRLHGPGHGLRRPVALYGLEVILNFVQALIFSVLTLIFTVLAIESHQHEEGHIGEEAVEAIHEGMHGEPQAAAAH